jgi:hypothetical protein
MKSKRNQKLFLIVLIVVAVLAVTALVVVFLIGNRKYVAGTGEFHADLCLDDQVVVWLRESGEKEVLDYECGEMPKCWGGKAPSYFEGGFFIGDNRVRSLSLTCPEEIEDFFKGQGKGFDKPVIYLYPERETDVVVKLGYVGDLLFTYPEIADGWRVTAFPDGKIVNKADGQEYSYLFWEGELATPGDYDWSKGFVVRGDEVREFLREQLSAMGLTPKEYNEFVVYWYPKMAVNEYNLVHFANDDEYGKYAELDIVPRPEAILRVMMVFKKIDGPVEVVAQQFDYFERNGFTVMEWGGTEVK